MITVPKIVLIILLALAVWLVFRWLNPGPTHIVRPPQSPAPGPRSPAAVEDLGAGTFHPATALRALGPEPWRAAYVQPSRRPTDGRYGENPNRLQHYYQLQVLLKPSPNDIQDIYLDSLRHL